MRQHSARGRQRVANGVRETNETGRINELDESKSNDSNGVPFRF
jgi:hypothetical protein